MWVYSKQNEAGLDLRLGQLFNILFIKQDDNNPAVSDMFYADGVDASQMIADWMEDCQISYNSIPIVCYKKLPDSLKDIVKQCFL
jgi:hypothetical protein